MRLNRKQKILRNGLACLVLILAIYASLGFPPYTVAGMCRAVQRDYLLPELTPVYTLKESHKYSDDWVNRRYTFIIARCEDSYFSFLYDRNLLENSRVAARGVKVGEGALCMARKGVMYVAGDFAGVERATAVVRATNGTEFRDFILEGERLGDEVFGFVYDDGGWPFAPEGTPVEEMSLGEIAEYWYRTPSGGGYSLDHAELPVTVTLKDAAGETVETLELSVGTYDLHSWY